jgi:predicted nucleotidyltransferase
MASAHPSPALLDLAEDDRAQLAALLQALRDVTGGGLVGAYLHGSAVLGGLQVQSDIDVLAVIERPLTSDERRRMIAQLLVVSGRYPYATPPRPLELTVVVRSEIHPWRYPPVADFQYGEWLRDRFEAGDPEARSSKVDPDLALLITMSLLGATPLVGPPPSEVFEPIPTEHVLDAMVEGVGALVADLDADTRNVVLTLARIWSGVVSEAILSKEAAAGWALPRLGPEHRAVLVRARDIYLGVEEEHWEDLHDRIHPFATAVVSEIEAARSSALRATPAVDDPTSDGVFIGRSRNGDTNDRR